MNLNKNLAYLLGVYMGDGAIWDNGNGTMVFGLMAIDKVFVEETARCIGEVTGETPSVHTCRKPDRRSEYFRCQSTNADLIQYLVHETHAKTIIPSSVLEAPADLKKEFIAGVLDSDGYVALSKRRMYGQHEVFDMRIGIAVQDTWLYEFREMLLAMGVACTKVCRCTALHTRSKIMYRFTIKKPSFIENGLYFKIPRKQSRIEYYKNLFPSSTTKRRIPFTDEHKQKISAALRGREFTETHKNNLSKARKKWIESHDDVVRDAQGRFCRR